VKVLLPGQKGPSLGPPSICYIQLPVAHSFVTVTAIMAPSAALPVYPRCCIVVDQTMLTFDQLVFGLLNNGFSCVALVMGRSRYRKLVAVFPLKMRGIALFALKEMHRVLEGLGCHVGRKCGPG
jgi:hypothetical protein